MEMIYLHTRTVIIGIAGMLIVSMTYSQRSTGQTEITRWQDGKKGAVSITYDDGSINQFRKAVPVMNRLGLPGTFFIITGSLPGSKYTGKFIGRPVAQIINETKTIPTNKDNVYERASAARYLGFKGTGDYFTRAGAQIDAGRIEEGCKIIDDLYQKVVNGELQPEVSENRTADNTNILTWDMVKMYVSQGHEFASHTVTHPYICALDEPNILYELEKSRQEILDRIGLKYTFSAECPYGTEDERAMQYAYKVYPALRNRIPEEYLLELNRGSRRMPVNADFEYVQWQRGIISRSTLSEINAWIDTTASQNNIWLVLVLHGIDGIGWESVSSQIVDDHFSYIKSKENDLWVATFGDVARYMKERMNAKVSSMRKGGNINVTITHSLDKELYNLPLTLKTYVDSNWEEAKVEQGELITKVNVQREGSSTFITYRAMPSEESITISKVK
jgi:peptidoglycan/xylan/chitin deacetylase (PgdA/CDA1 family)